MNNKHYQQSDRKWVFYVFLISSITMLSSCVSYKNTSRVGAVADTKVSLVTNIADVEVDFRTRITATSAKTWHKNDAKDQAYYRAIIYNPGVDVLVDPIYEVRTRCRRSVATVTGYAGRYKNVRTAKVEKQEVFEQDLKNAQISFDQSMSILDKRMAAFEKFTKVSAVATEDLKTHLIIAGGSTGTAIDKEINTNISIVDKYNKFNTGGATALAAAAMGTAPVAVAIPMLGGMDIITKVRKKRR